MAMNAHQATERKMSAAREAELAALIMNDIEIRREKAQENGVLAYARRPIPRGRPNERFLQNTLKNLDTANRRKQESEMWEQYEANHVREKERHVNSGRVRGRGQISYQPPISDSDSDEYERLKRRKRSRSEISETSFSGSEDKISFQKHDQEEYTDSDTCNDLVEKNIYPTPNRPVRGRGTVGSKAEDDIGPFLVPENEEERVLYDDERYKKRKKAGPERPTWLEQDKDSPPPTKRGDKYGALLNVFSEDSVKRRAQKKAEKKARKEKRKEKRRKEKHKRKQKS